MFEITGTLDIKVFLKNLHKGTPLNSTYFLIQPDSTKIL